MQKAPRILKSSLRAIARDKRAATGLRVRACELLMVVEGYKVPQATAAKKEKTKATRARAKSGDLRELLGKK